MKPAEFEEREYEAPLYSQLRHGPHDVWAPGQVLEAHVGFDCAILTTHPQFWNLHGFPTPLTGAILSTRPFDYWWGHDDADRDLPDFSLNLFIQAKRPLVGTRATKALKAKGITSPYWKFLIEAEQQRTLEVLSRSTLSIALVCYACAAFDRTTQLWAHSRAGSIVEASTFPSAASLHGHTAWYYDEAGCTGVANPTPERIHEPTLAQRIAGLVRGSNDIPDQRSDLNLGRLVEAIKRSVAPEETIDSGRTAIFLETLRDINSAFAEARSGSRGEALRDFATVSAFTSIFRLQWYVLGRRGLLNRPPAR